MGRCDTDMPSCSSMVPRDLYSHSTSITVDYTYSLHLNKSAEIWAIDMHMMLCRNNCLTGIYRSNKLKYPKPKQSVKWKHCEKFMEQMS